MLEMHAGCVAMLNQLFAVQPQLFCQGENPNLQKPFSQTCPCVVSLSLDSRLGEQRSEMEFLRAVVTHNLHSFCFVFVLRRFVSVCRALVSLERRRRIFSLCSLVFGELLFGSLVSGRLVNDSFLVDKFVLSDFC